MIKVNLLVVGKVKEKYFSDGINEYAKRLSRYCDFNIIEVQEENFTKVDDSIANFIKEREADRLLPHVKGHVIALAIEGKKYSSTSFAKNIGGSYGIADRVKQKANSLMSFSDMTFPHTLFRLMLTEQIYRAFSIINGSAYHK